jgi:mandelamide amidase
MARQRSTERRQFLLTALATTGAVAGAGLMRAANAATAPNGVEDMTATQAVTAMRSGDVSAEKYVEALLERARRLSWMAAFISLNRDGALEAARNADKKRAAGGKLPALHGLPVVLKDNIDTAQLPTTGGTAALRNHRPKKDAPVAASLLNAGAVLLGKTNMHELAFGISNNNGAFGAVSNPYDGALIPGGSSGGTGAAVAARIAPAGLGSDTGGSVRIPAALCGIAGFRPSIGRYSGAGMIPISHTRDTAGPMCRTVADCALLDAVITSAPTAKPLPPEGLRLGVPRGYFWENLDNALSSVAEESLRRLRAYGVELIEVDLPDLKKLNDAVSFPIALYEVGVDLPRYLEESGSGVTFKKLISEIKSPDVKGVFEAFVVGPQAVPKAAYDGAINAGRPALQAAYADYFRRHNLAGMIYPTTPMPARPIGHDSTVQLNGQAVPTFFTFIRNTDPSSNAGLPSVAIPVGMTVDNLPVGMELTGPTGTDRDLLAVGIAIEGIFGSLAAPVI